MNDIARLGYEIDSSQAKGAAAALLNMNKAAAQAELGAAKLRKSLQTADGTFRKVEDAAEEFSDTIRALAGEFNPALSAQLRFADGQKRVAEAIRLGVIEADGEKAALERLQASMLSTSTAAATLGKGMQASSQHTSNLMFQFQDIGMMLAAGQNPLMLAMQQGTQVSGVFHQMRESGQSAFSGIVGGLSAMLNPMSLLTIGTIAGGAALVQWGMSAMGASEETRTFRETVDELESSVSAVNEISKIYSAEGLQSILDKYGEINGEILAMVENQKEFAIASAMESARTAAAALRDEYIDLLNTVDVSQDAPKALTRELGLSAQEAVNLRTALNQLRSAGSFEEQAAALRVVNDILSKSKVRASELAGAALDAEDAMRQLSDAAPAPNWMSAAIGGVMSLGEAIRGRISEARSLAALANAPGMTTGNADWAKNDLGFNLPGGELLGLPAAPSGGGGGGGGGGGEDPYEANLNRLVESLQTEREVTDTWYAESMTILQDRRAMELLGAQGHADALLMIEEELQRRKADVRDEDLGHYQSFFGSMAGAMQSGGSKMLAISKGFALAEAAVSIWRGAAKALELPFPASLAAWGQVIATGAKALSGIKSASFGGGGSGGSGRATGTTSATAARAEPERVTRVALQGEGWLVDMADSIMSQIYDATGRGRVVVSRAAM